MPTPRSDREHDKSADKSEEKRQAMAGTQMADANEDEMTQTRQTRSSNDRRRADSRSARSEGRSFGKMISESLAEESQQGVDRVLGDIREGIDVARDYVAENPREAVALAVAAGAVAWALLGTKPGRKVFEAGAAIAVPYATKWVARNMADALR